VRESVVGLRGIEGLRRVGFVARTLLWQHLGKLKRAWVVQHSAISGD
jgi:hypothetical protein